MNKSSLLRPFRLPLIAATVVLLAQAGPLLAQTKVLIDFGNNPTYGCVSTPGNWNSVGTGFTSNLIATNGVPTTIDYAPTAIGGTDSYNSIVGATTWDATNVPTMPQVKIDEADAKINKPALGDLGVAEAAIDFFASNSGQNVGRLELQQLTAGQVYTLTFYGTKQFVAAGNEQTKYSVYSDSGYSALLGQATLTTGTTNGDGNPNATASITVTAPANLNTVLYVQWEGVNDSTKGYLNSLSIEEVPFTPAAGTGVLIDLGNTNSFRGASQVGADTKGNFWNSVNNLAFWTNLVNTTGAPTSVNFGFTTVGASDSYNGPAGPTTNPITQPQIDATQINSGLLGPLGGSLPGAFDYYVNSTFQIQNLNPAKSYQLAFFGSHKFNNDDTTRYTVYTDGTFTTPVVSTDLLIGVGSAHNQSRVAVLDSVSPQTNGIIYVGFTGANGGDGYLNALMLVELSGSTFAGWSGGMPPTTALVAKYAFGGASSPTANDGETETTTLSPTTLTLTVIVRTNDPALTVQGEATENLALGPWSTAGVTFIADPNQAGVPAGCERRIYSVARGVGPKNNLRVKATLAP